MYGPNYTI